MKRLLISAICLAACNQPSTNNFKKADSITNRQIEIYWQMDSAAAIKDTLTQAKLNAEDEKLDSTLYIIYQNLPDTLKNKINAHYSQETSLKKRLERQAEKMR